MKRMGWLKTLALGVVGVTAVVAARPSTFHVERSTESEAADESHAER